MAKWNRNAEGYADRTAGIAIQNISREERKIIMAKKRSCRRTADENIIHEKAVKIRKMTDKQLVQYVKDREESAWNKGFCQGQSQAQKPNLDEILYEIQAIRGIGIVKVNKIKTVIQRGLGI